MMNDQLLERALEPQDKALRLNGSSLTDGFRAFLDKYFYRYGKELAISQAQRTVDGVVSTVTGKASFLNIPDLPLTARFAPNEDNEVVATLRYTLIDGSNTSRKWAFGRSFANLPLPDTGSSDKPLLDSLLFSYAEVVVTNHPQTHPECGVVLEPGINFVAKVRPSGVLGVAGTLLASEEDVVISGLIKLPPDDSSLSLPDLSVDPTGAQVYPWEVADQLPGVHLKINLRSGLRIGKGRLEDLTLRLYCPLESDWLMRGDHYQPLIGVTGNLVVPDADLKIEMIGRNVPGLNSVFFEARMEGMSVSNLSKLSGLTGQKKLFGGAPTGLQKALEGAAKIELLDLAFGVSMGKAGVDVSSITVQIGAPNVNWKLWKNHIVLTGVGSRLTINSPFNTPSVDAQVWGCSEIEGVPIKMSATSAGGWAFMATLEEGQTIPLGKLMKSYTPTVEAPANLTIDDMLLVVGVGSGLRLVGGVAQSPGWTIQLGTERLTVKDLKFDLGVTWNGDVAGQFRGSVKLGSVELELKYAVPGEVTLRSECDEITLKELSKRFTGSKRLLPSGFNPRVTDAVVLLKTGKQGTVFQVGGSSGGDCFVFEASKAPSRGWGFASGLRLTDPRLSKLPGLEALKPLEKVVKLEDLTVVAANYESKDFRFPALSSFSNPTLTNQNMPMPAQSSGLQPGLNVFAAWRLDTSNKQMKLVRKMLGLDPKLDVTVQVSPQPAKGSRVFVDYETTVNKKWPLDCQLGFGVNEGTPEFFLAGELQAKIQKQPCTFDVAMSVVKSGMYLGGTMEGTVTFDTLKLSNLSLMFGMNWGGVPSLGVAGEIDMPKFSGSVALMFDANDPSRSLVAGSVSDLTLRDVVGGLAKVTKVPASVRKTLDRIGLEGTQGFTLPVNAAAALDDIDLPAVAKAFKQYGKVSLASSADQVLLVVKKPGKSWRLTDLKNNMMHYQLTKTVKGIVVTLDPQLYVAPQSTQIGTLQFDQGFFLNGILNIMGFKWASTVNVSARKGVAVDTYLNKPLVIYKSQFFAISDTKAKTGPRLSVSTYNQPKHAVKEFRKPHFYISGKMALLGLDVAATYVEISESGFHFYFEQNQRLGIGCKSLSGSVTSGFAIRGSFDSATNFGAGGTANLVVKGKVNLAQIGGFRRGAPAAALKKLGSISVDLKANGKVDTGYARKKAYARFEGSFSFDGKAYRVKKELDANTKAMTKLGDVVYGEVKQAFRDVVKTAEQWANWVKRGVIQGVGEMKNVGSVLKDVYGKSAKDAARILDSMGATVDQIGGVLKNTYKQTGEQAAKIFKEIGKDSKAVAKTLKNTFRMSAKSVSKTMKGVYKLGKDDLKKTLKGAGYASKEVSKAVDSTFKKLKKAFKF